jgi:3-deoxy-7-phosphoheptulonate synthase
MIIVLKHGVNKTEIAEFSAHLKSLGVGIHESSGVETTILGLVGDTSRLNESSLAAHSIVEKVMRVNEPYKMANRKFHPEDTVVEIENAENAIVGKNHFAIMAGPCSVESREQITGIARAVKASGATFLRGGAFKPRTSPYAFQGLGTEGLDLLLEAKKMLLFFVAHQLNSNI